MTDFQNVRPTFLPQLRPPQRDEQPTLRETMSAAFALENDMVNLLEYLGRDTPPMDDTFNVMKRGPQSDLWQQHSDILARAQSEAEFDMLERRVRLESEQRELLASQGMGGFLAGMGAALFSPVMFIPLVGGARGAAGVAQAFGLAAAAASAQEGALLLNQLTRTPTEAGFAIAGGTVLGGLLGSAAMMLRRSDFDRLSRGLEPDASSTPTSFVVRRPDGSFTRVGDDVPLQMPVGVARTPAAAVEITLQQSQGRVVREAAGSGGLPAVQRIAADEAADPAARAIAQRALDTRFDSERLLTVAESAGVPRPLASAWARAEQATEALARGDTTAQESLDIARREFGEAFDALRPQEQADIEALLRRISQQEDAALGARVNEIVEENTAPLRMSEEDVQNQVTYGGSAGAKQTAEQFTPTIHYVDPETGETIIQPLIPYDAPVDPGLTRSMTPLGNKLTFVNPVIRVIEQKGMPIKSETARHMMRQLSDGGVGYEGARFGIAPTAEGTLEHRLGYYHGLMARALREQYEGYIRYLGKEHQGFFARRGADFQILFNLRPRGKMNFAEFKEQVAHALNQGDRSDITEVAQVARAWRKDFYEPINQAMLEATEDRGYRALYNIMEQGPDKSYFTHQFNPMTIANDRDGFVQMVAEHWNNVSSAVFTRRWQRLMDREAGELELEGILRMSREEALAELDKTRDALAAAPRASDLDPRVDQVRGLRDAARELREEEFERLLRDLESTRGGAVDPESQAALVRQARQNTKEQYDALRAQADELEAALPKSVTRVLDDTRKLRARQRAINQSFGKIEADRARVLNQIEQNEDRNLRAIESLLTKHRTFLRQMERLDDARLNEELGKLERAFESTARQLDKGDERINRLYERFGPEGSEFEPTERLSIERARQGMREERLQRQFDRLSAATTFDRQAARDAVQARLDTAMEYVNRVNGQRAARNERLRQRLETLNPEDVGRRIEGMRSARQQRWDEFEDAAREAGASMVDLEQGAFDFLDTARDLALDLSHRITGNPSRIGQLDIMPELRGPMKQRLLNIPYEQKQKWLDLDTERVIGRYTRTIGADIELFRAFGSVSGKNMLQAVKKELDEIGLRLAQRKTDANGKPITDAQRLKDQKAHQAGAIDIMYSLEGQIDRLRGLRGIPSDPTSIPYRLGRAFMHSNMVTMMGVAAITSIPDFARPVFAHGLVHTFRTAWMPLVQGLISTEQNLINRAVMRELKLYNISVEVFSQQRARGFYDFTADMPGTTRIERGLEWMSQKMPQVALFGQWTDWNKGIAGMATMARMLGSIEDLARGTLRQAEIQYLADAGINPDMARRINAQLNTPNGSTRHGDVLIPNTEAWTDYQALRAFYAAMQRESDRMVISPGLERPMWMDQNILFRMVGQFRSFTMSAHSKMLLSGLQSRDMALFNALQGVVFSLGLGTLSYYIWALTTGKRAYEEMLDASWETWIDQAIYRSGLTGALSELQMIGAELPLTRPYVHLAGSDLAGRRAQSLMGAVGGPSFGKAWDIATFLQNVDSPTQGTISQARKLIPYQNVFWLRQGFNQVEEGVANLFNVPERRQ